MYLDINVLGQLVGIKSAYALFEKFAQPPGGASPAPTAPKTPTGLGALTDLTKSPPVSSLLGAANSVGRALTPPPAPPPVAPLPDPGLQNKMIGIPALSPLAPRLLAPRIAPPVPEPPRPRLAPPIAPPLAPEWLAPPTAPRPIASILPKMEERLAPERLVPRPTR